MIQDQPRPAGRSAMKKSLYGEWMTRLQMFLAAKERAPSPAAPAARS